MPKNADGSDQFETALRRAWEVQNGRTELASNRMRSASRLPEDANQVCADPDADKNSKPGPVSLVPDPQRHPDRVPIKPEGGEV